jgi:hypothetical protein
MRHERLWTVPENRSPTVVCHNENHLGPILEGPREKELAVP